MILENIKKSVSYIEEKCGKAPELAITLGSGLGHFVDQLEVLHELPYAEIPGFIPPSVEGHSGQLVIAKADKKILALLQGRVHYYEGHSMEEVVHPTRTLACWGVNTFVVTNSAGGLNPDIQPGTFMILRDQINFTGENPLRGKNLEELGPRFPDMTAPFDPSLSDKLENILKQKSIPYFNGTYVGVQGPTYETAAEVRLFGELGGGAVGMSTVPEVIAARHMNKKVVGISCITNLGTGLSSDKLSHDDVKEVAQRVGSQFSDFLADFVKNI